MVNPSRPCLNRRHLGSSLLPVRERKKEQSFSELLYAPEPVRTRDSCIPRMRYRAFAWEYLINRTKAERTSTNSPHASSFTVSLRSKQ